MSSKVKSEDKDLLVFCGQFLSQIRTKKKKYQYEIAPRLGVSQQMLSRYETGKAHMTLETFSEFCTALGIKMSDVILAYEREKDRQK